jgi:quinol monooxygenase YgiN
MAAGKVTVVAVLVAKHGLEAKVREELELLLAPTRKEEGCLNYDLHHSVDDSTRFMFHENWRSKQDLDAHLASAHLVRFQGLAGELFAEAPQITLWEEIG